MGIGQRFDLSAKVAVVTGGGRGIGEGIAHAFVDAGAAVVLAARRADDVTKVCTDIQNNAGKALATEVMMGAMKLTRADLLVLEKMPNCLLDVWVLQRTSVHVRFIWLPRPLSG